MRGHRTLAVAIVLLLGLAAPRVEAASCSVTVSSGVSFGAYNVFNSTALDGVGTIRIACNQSWVFVRVTLSAGSSNSFTARTLRSGANQLQYNLYTSATRTTVWGDETGGTSAVYLFPAPSTTRSVYGRIPAGQDAAVGSYTDTITVRVDY